MAGETAYYDIRIRVFDKPLDDLEKKTDRFESKVGGLGRSFARAFGATAVLAGVGLLTKKIVGLGAEMEQTRVSFTTMLGSADKANSTLKELSKFAIATPFRQGEVVGGAKMLLAYGFAANGLTDNLRMLGDVSSGLSIPLGDLVYLYGTVRTQGKAMTKDIMQFANRGIPIYDALNKVTGKYGDSLQKAIENGEITFEVIEKAFKNMTKQGSMFGGLMEKQSKTLAGRWSTFLDVLENTGRSIGEKINPSLGLMLDKVSGFLSILKPTNLQLQEQIDKNKTLKNVVTPLMDRYNDLSKKIFKTKEESDELKSITKSLADLVPSAVSAWDNYGNAIGISNSKMEESIRLSKLRELELKKEVASENRLTSGALMNRAASLRHELTSGTSLSKFGRKKLSDKELQDRRDQLMAITGEGGDLEKSIMDVFSSTGSLGNKELESAAKSLGLGDVYKRVLKRVIQQRQAGVFTSGVSGTSTTGAVGASVGGTQAGLEKISSATRNVTLNITKLIENLNFTKDPSKNEYDMEEMVKRVLLRAVNDVNIVAQ